MDSDFKFLLGVLGVIFLLCGGFFGLFAWAESVEDAKWDTYARRYECTALSTSVVGTWTVGTHEAPATCHNTSVTCYVCAPGPKGTSVCR